MSSEQSDYRHWRVDGWPYCPRCDEDELYSLAMPATVETICGCYRCGRWPLVDRSEWFNFGDIVLGVGRTQHTGPFQAPLDVPEAVLTLAGARGSSISRATAVSAIGWRIHWTHLNGRDHFIGDLWPDRATAEEVARSLIESGYCLNVRIVRSSS